MGETYMVIVLRARSRTWTPSLQPVKGPWACSACTTSFQMDWLSAFCGPCGFAPVAGEGIWWKLFMV